jgi:hypothetical protein
VNFRNNTELRRRHPLSANLADHFRSLLSPESRDSVKTMLDWSKCAAVERVPGKVSGAWLFKGTRVPVTALFENLEGGAAVD